MQKYKAKIQKKRHYIKVDLHVIQWRSIWSPTTQSGFWFPQIVCVSNGAEITVSQSIVATQFNLFYSFIYLLFIYYWRTCNVHKAHLPKKSVSSITTFQQSAVRAVKGCQGKIVDLHEAGVGYKTISKMFSEKVTSVGAIIWKWQWYEMVTSHPHSGCILDARSCFMGWVWLWWWIRPKLHGRSLLIIWRQLWPR